MKKTTVTAGPPAVRADGRRVSLAEVRRSAAHAEQGKKGRSAELAPSDGPTLDDLTECLVFALGDGRIWLNDQRMVLVHTATLGRLRRELIDSLGHDKAKALITRVGYAQGVRDATLVRERWPDHDLTQVFAAGPRLHTLEGFVKVTTLNFEYDLDNGIYDGEFLWEDSSEADEHLACYGLSTSPVCWLQTAYATGYTSHLLGRPVLFREIECRGMGARHCRCIGRSAEAWGDGWVEMESLGMVPTPAPRERQPASNPADPADMPVLAAFSGEQGAMVGVSASFMTARHKLDKVARTRATVLLIGESGAGKEVFANALHQASDRRERPFVAINCAAIPEQLIEAELFGVERGAFTGAVASRPGRFERAAGGTLFLDEVASLSLVAQGKLLRAVQEREIERVGGTRTIAVDVRLVTATNIDLRDEIRAGRFRADLFFRLNVFPIEIPPLRDRRDDLPLLMAHFLALYGREHGRRPRGFTRRATEALLRYHYPGNIRELQNLIERGVVYGDDDGLIDSIHMFRPGEDTPPPVALNQHGQLGSAASGTRATAPGNSPAAAAERPIDHFLNQGTSVAEIERQLYTAALARHDGNIAAAARQLGLSRPAFEYRLKKYQLYG